MKYIDGYNKGFADAEVLYKPRIATLEKRLEELKKTPSYNTLQSRVQWLQIELDRATAGKHWKIEPLQEL